MIHYAAAAAFCMSVSYMYARSLGRCPATYAAVWLDEIVMYDGNAEYQRLFFVDTPGTFEAVCQLTV